MYRIRRVQFNNFLSVADYFPIPRKEHESNCLNKGLKRKHFIQYNQVGICGPVSQVQIFTKTLDMQETIEDIYKYTRNTFFLLKTDWWSCKIWLTNSHKELYTEVFMEYLITRSYRALLSREKELNLRQSFLESNHYLYTSEKFA